MGQISVEISGPNGSVLSGDQQSEVRAKFLQLPAKLNLFRMLANSPGTFASMMALISSVFGKLDLHPRLREIAILYTVRWTSADYIWRQHLQIAPQAGVAARQIEAIRDGRIHGADVFDADERLILKMANELLGSDEISEVTLNRALARFSVAQIVETILLVGFYRMLAGVMRSTELDLDVQSCGDWTKRMSSL